MPYFKPFKSFAVVTCDGVDADLPTLACAKRHQKELLKDLDMQSTIYEVTGSPGHDETDALWAEDGSINDVMRGGHRHYLTKGQIAKIMARHGVDIKQH